MTKVIIYKREDGRISVISPAGEYVEVFGIDAIALKDVPPGIPYKIMDSDDIPSPIDGWSVDDSELSDGVGAFYGPGSKYAVVGYAEDLTPILRELKLPE